MLDYDAKLAASVALVMGRCGSEEVKAYQPAVGKKMGEMLFEVMIPVNEVHPDLRPPELDA